MRRTQNTMNTSQYNTLHITSSTTSKINLEKNNQLSDIVNNIWKGVRFVKEQITAELFILYSVLQSNEIFFHPI